MSCRYLYPFGISFPSFIHFLQSERYITTVFYFQIITLFTAIINRTYLNCSPKELIQIFFLAHQIIVKIDHSTPIKQSILYSLLCPFFSQNQSHRAMSGCLKIIQTLDNIVHICIAKQCQVLFIDPIQSHRIPLELIEHFNAVQPSFLV